MLNLWFDLFGSLATAMAGEESGIVRKLMLKLTAKIAALLPGLWEVGRTLDNLAYLVFSQPPACLHQAM